MKCLFFGKEGELKRNLDHSEEGERRDQDEQNGHWQYFSF